MTRTEQEIREALDAEGFTAVDFDRLKNGPRSYLMTAARSLVAYRLHEKGYTLEQIADAICKSGNPNVAKEALRRVDEAVKWGANSMIISRIWAAKGEKTRA